MNTSIKLTVLFEGIFWVGIFEKVSSDNYSVSRVVFGSEPKDYEVYDFILQNFYNLNFTNGIANTLTVESNKISPKRLQKQIKKATETRGVGTKAQLAIKMQHEENKLERKKVSKEQKEAEKDRKFQLKQEKKLMKHKGH